MNFTQTFSVILIWFVFCANLLKFLILWCSLPSLKTIEKMHSRWCFGFGILVFISGCQICWTQDFGYNGDKGPTHWGEQYNECTGKHQSPINIDSLHVKRVILPTLQLNGFDVPPDKTMLKNNGHTVMITMDSKVKPTISGGPLHGVYEFAQFHFHWGDNDTVGSEDLIDGRSFPMELHMVFFNKEYLDAKEAMQHSDGLCVLAFFYDLNDKDNENYEEFSEVVSHVTNPESIATFTRPVTLLKLMPKDLDHYFTYNGSLTTPPCSEIVTWIDFKEPILLSHDQIHKFRDLLDEDGHVLTHNFRPIQPLGDRIILFNIIDNDDNTLENHNIDDDIPPVVDDNGNNDISDSLDEVDNGKKNVLKDPPDNSLENKVETTTKKNAKLDSGAMANFGSFYLLSITILCFTVSSR